ncbi:MAG TPA: alkaline phosphatase PhoX [Actinomycetota bacterium]|nr:alkaline phosphatase PhoX [Actinomycetota bacterium]
MCAVTVGAAVAAVDWGQQEQARLQSHAQQLFGVGSALTQSSSQQVTQEQAEADPTSLVTLAAGLKARVVTVGQAPNVLDMIALWPNDSHPQWLVECNETDDTSEPGLVRINVATGDVATIVTGTSDCDPVRRTGWGAIVFGEEAGGGSSGGALYELLDPVGTTNVVLDRTTGTFSGGTGSENLVARPAVGRLSFEGLALYPNGVLYYGDENRPASGSPGGGYFKFVPSDPSDGTSIDSLADSPLVSGSIYGLRLGLRSNGTDYGQGTETGFGKWIPICSGATCSNIDLRAQTASLKLTGYYRPEDAEVDAAALAATRVRFCGNNTGNESNDQMWGETICVTDGTLEQATAGTAVPEVQRLVQGRPALAMPDNLAFQPGRHNLVIHEDADTTYLSPHNDDLWDCLPDGGDDDLQSDGCIRIATLNDLTAEWTGGIFDATGKRFFVSVQHNISGFGVVLEITGWK